MPLLYSTSKMKWVLLEFSILFSENVEIDWSPEASSLSTNDDNCRRIDRKKDAGSSATIPRMFHSFTRTNWKKERKKVRLRQNLGKYFEPLRYSSKIRHFIHYSCSPRNLPDSNTYILGEYDEYLSKRSESARTIHVFDHLWVKVE